MANSASNTMKGKRKALIFLEKPLWANSQLLGGSTSITSQQLWEPCVIISIFPLAPRSSENLIRCFPRMQAQALPFQVQLKECVCNAQEPSNPGAVIRSHLPSAVEINPKQPSMGLRVSSFRSLCSFMSFESSRNQRDGLPVFLRVF